MPVVDVVVVSYNSREYLRPCLEPLAPSGELRVIVVDNASTDGTADSIADLDATVLRQAENRGFASGCNIGWRAGSAPFVLFLNPDTMITPASILDLVGALERDSATGLVGPRIVDRNGRLEHSQFRFARPTSYWAGALFLHRVFPGSSWASGTVADDGIYALPASPDWVSGAGMLLRRTTLEQLGGLDEGYFMYCEDMDLGRRVRELGLAVRFEPAAKLVHVGGASAPSAGLQPVLVRSRIRYARKHFSKLGYLVARVGIAASELTRIAVARGGREARAGHARGLLCALAPSRSDTR